MTEPPAGPGQPGSPDPNQPYSPPPQGYQGQQPPGYQQQPGYEQPGYQQGSYQQPGYQPPPGGYPPGPGPMAPAPVGYANADEKTWALIAHFGGALTGFIAPLIVLVTKGNESPTVRTHTVAALNFQILWSIISAVSVTLGSCLFFLIVPMLLWAVPLVQIIFGIIAGIKANEGVLYKYPLTVNWVK